MEIKTILSKGPYLATFADPSNSTIYNQPFFTKRAAATKIPHLLCEKTYLKPRIECMILLTKNDFIYKNVVYDRDGRKTAKTFPIWLPFHPTSMVWRPTVFGCPRTRKTSWTYTKRERDLIHWDKKKKTGLGMVRTGNMNLYKWNSKIFRKSGLE